MLKHTAYPALLATLFTPALALSPPVVTCGNGDGTGAIEIFTYAEDDPEMPGMTIFTATRPGPVGKTRTTVLAHCGTGQSTTWRVDYDDYDTDDAIIALLNDNPKMTLRTLARRIDRMEGAEASFGRLPAGHCACRPETHLY